LARALGCCGNDSPTLGVKKEGQQASGKDSISGKITGPVRDSENNALILSRWTLGAGIPGESGIVFVKNIVDENASSRVSVMTVDVTNNSSAIATMRENGASYSNPVSEEIVWWTVESRDSFNRGARMGSYINLPSSNIPRPIL
jgi:hypothetical protein